MAETACENESYFCELDSVAGDGDFGYSLARGFEVVLREWASYDQATASEFLIKIASAITSRMGGTSGPIWGTGFLRAGMSLRSKADPGRADVIDALRSAIEGIMARGSAALGDKTLLDALVPAVDAFAGADGDPVDTRSSLERATTAARDAAESTRTMQARRGRASYSGERSIGSIDPGAVAVATMIQNIANQDFFPDNE